ncbi:MAG: hypothetical protein H6658_19050 [Ardenticatenaceae bacterium]|nr:hypothetical protein [Ardenticatenaceae bacterium]
MTDILQLIADDHNRVSYHPKWNGFTGGVTSSIFLQQAIYWWVRSKRRPFYKFNEPCSHRAYKDGDSWSEELGFSRKELETARGRVASRTKGDISSDSLISYWVDASRKTWYAVNEVLLLEKLAEIYPEPVDNSVGVQEKLMYESDISNEGEAELMYESDISNDELMYESDIRANARKSHYLMPESDIRYTETTTDTTITTTKKPPLPPPRGGGEGKNGGGGGDVIREMLTAAGIWSAQAAELAALGHMTREFVAAWLDDPPLDDEDRVNYKLLYYRLKNNLPPPEGDDEAERLRNQIPDRLKGIVKS